MFDAALFHFDFVEYGTPDPAFYSNMDTLVVKFVGGGDYSYKHVTNIPEPATLLFLLTPGLILITKRK